MAFLVTGAGGFVGREVVGCLAASGHRGIAVGREAPPDLPEGWVGRSRFDMLAAPWPTGITAVIHLEGIHGGPGTTEADVERVNVGGTREWLAWASRCDVKRFVFVSSMMAVQAGSGPIGEDAPPAVGTGYGVSKARAEAVVGAWADAAEDRRAVILRPAPVYGPDGRSNFLPLVRRVMAGRPALIGDGHVPRAVVSRRNLAAAVAFSLRYEKPGVAVFNVSDTPTLSTRQLAELVARLADAPAPRSIPLWLVRIAAPLGTLVEQITGRVMPLSLSKKRVALEPTDLPCRKLVAAGYKHAETTEEGVAAVVEWAIRNVP